jgi:hypothetical protein
MESEMPQWLLDFELNSFYIVTLFTLGFVYTLFTLYRLSSASKILQHKIFQLQNEIRAINSGNLGMGRKISRFAEEIANVDINQLQQDSDQSEKSYQQASLLLSRGATIEEVVDSCEISPAEAELLAIMRHSTPAKMAQAV